MSVLLTQSQQLNATISTYKINSFSFDNDTMRLHLGYQELDGATVIAEKAVTIQPPESVAAIQAVQTEYDTIKSALYNLLMSYVGVTGTQQ